MAVSISELEASNPAALTDAGERATAAAEATARQIANATRMVAAMAEGWSGDGAAAATGKANDNIRRHAAFQHTLHRTGELLTAGGKTLTQARTGILNEVGRLKSQGWQVADDGSVSVRRDSALDLYAKLNPVGAMTLRVLSARSSSDLKVALAEFTAADQTLAERLKDFGPEPDDPENHDYGSPGLTDEEKAEMAHWSQFFAASDSDNGGGDCSRWATASALANKYGTREGPNGKEVDLPVNVQEQLMDGAPLHFPPTKTEIDQIAHRQGVAAGNETAGFPGGPDLMSQQLNQIGVPSQSHTGDPAALVDQMTIDLSNGHAAIVNGAFPGSGGHFISVTGTAVGPNGETLYVVNDSNRVSNGSANNHTVPSPCTRSQLEQFLRDRAQYGLPGYSTV